MLVSSAALSVALLLITILSICNHPHWIFRLFDFPRLQIAAVSLFVVIYFIVAIAQQADIFHLTGLGALFALIYQLSWIYAYTPLAKREVKNAVKNPDEQTDIKLLTSNVLQTNTEYEALLALVKETDPDILITLESDKHWQHALSALSADMPYHVDVPQDNLYGMHLFSKYPLSDSKIKRRIKNDIPSISALIKVCGEPEPIKLEVLHPMPPSPTEAQLSLSRDKELIQVAKELRDEKRPIIVAGDLNDVAWSSSTRLFKKISCLFDPRVGRGWYSTFHTRWWCFRWPLDHVFVSQHFSVKKISTLRHIGSDHFPMLIHLQLEQSTTTNQKTFSHEEKTQREKSLEKDRVNNR